MPRMLLLAKYRDTIALRRFLLCATVAAAVLFSIFAEFSSSGKGVTLESREKALAAIMDRSRSVGNQISTLSCPNLLEQSEQNRLSFEDPNHHENGAPAHLATTKTTHPFQISLHNRRFDKKRWVLSTNGHYDEVILEDIWQAVLKDAPPNSRVLDVGANIGYFTLLSGSMMTKEKQIIIDSFEPNLKNALRLCESIQANQWVDNVHIHPMGVSNQPGIFAFTEDRSNPGASHFNNKETTIRGAVQEIPVTTLDRFAKAQGWLSNDRDGKKPIIAILKIDVEGFEPAVILGAEQLLGRHIIQNVFMEITVADAKQSELVTAGLHLLQTVGYKLEGLGEGQGPGEKVPADWPSGNALTGKIVRRAETTKNRQLNLWWKL